jgi:precorrin-6B methylase 2
MNPQQIREQFSAFQNSRILLTAFELGVFTEIEKGKGTSEEISDSLQTDERATDRLLNALVVIGYLHKEKNIFQNKDFVSKYLVKGSPDFISGLYHTNHMWDSWSFMTDVIKKGKPDFNPSIQEKRGNWLEAFIEAMDNRAKVQTKPSVEVLDLTNVNKVLDVGGGSAAFSIEFVRHKESLRATVFDLPNVTPITETYIKKRGFSEKINTYNGDYTVNELPKGFDLIYLSAIIHANSFEQNKELIKKCSESLNPGGQIVVQDYIMNDDRTEPARGAIFALNMLTGTQGGDTYTENEIKSWMKDAGLSGFKRNNLHFGADQIIGFKKSFTNN